MLLCFLNYRIICFIFQVNPRYHNQSYINGDRWSSTNTSEFPPINRPRLVKIVSFWLTLLLVGLICAIIYLAHIRGKHLNFKQNLKVVLFVFLIMFTCVSITQYKCNCISCYQFFKSKKLPLKINTLSTGFLRIQLF